MRTRTTSRLAWGLCALSIVSIVVVSVYGVFGPPTDQLSTASGGIADWIATVVFVAVFSTVGALVASRRPANPIGWLLVVTALCYSVATASIFIALRPWGERIAAWMGNWIWALGLALPLTFVPLLFPNGHLPSRRWRPVAWLAGIGIVAFVIGSAFAPGLLPDSEPPTINPFGVGGAVGHAVFGAMRTYGLALFLLMTPLALASLVFRYRRAERPERAQLRWLIFAGVVVGLGILANGLIGLSDSTVAVDIGNAVVSIAAAALPIAIGIAILKDRLYDIDVVLNKTVVYGALAAFITVVYVAIVVGVGSLVGRGGEPNVPLSILATALVAVAFQPVRERVQRFANRLVYGKRATPYEVLSTFSEQMGDTYASEDLLPRMARILAEGAGATRADVWLDVDGELRVAASWPARDRRPDPISPDRAPEDIVAVRYQGEMLGALQVEKQPGEALTHTERTLVENLASQAGLVLKNVGPHGAAARAPGGAAGLSTAHRCRAGRGTTQARAQHPRRGPAAARGALGEAEARATPPSTETRMRQVSCSPICGRSADDALENLRDLARGIYPPLLQDQGLVAALAAQARRATVPTQVTGKEVGRFAQDIEAAVYFWCLEALQNVAKYAAASQAEITISDDGERLRFDVTDDGDGFDPAATGYGTGLQGMADRLAALGGDTRSWRVGPGRGTSISGSLPITRSVWEQAPRSGSDRADGVMR